MIMNKIQGFWNILKDKLFPASVLNGILKASVKPNAISMAIITKIKDSSMNWLVILFDADPRVLRIPTSLARLADLAVARFIKLIHAITMMKIAIAEKI